MAFGIEPTYEVPDRLVSKIGSMRAKERTEGAACCSSCTTKGFAPRTDRQATDDCSARVWSRRGRSPPGPWSGCRHRHSRRWWSFPRIGGHLQPVGLVVGVGPRPRLPRGERAGLGFTFTQPLMIKRNDAGTGPKMGGPDTEFGPCARVRAVRTQSSREMGPVSRIQRSCSL